MSVLEKRLEFWLVTTDHLTDRIWFRDEEDFRMGMNLVVVLVCALGVNVLSFILMSNHVHFVLSCSYEKAIEFIEEYKRRYAQYAHWKYGTWTLLRRNRFKVDSIDGNNESLEWAIAYVQMNSVAANICLTPNAYPWGTGDSFFKVKQAKGRRVGDLSRRSLRHILHSRQELPANLLLGDDGYILPESYVQVQLVQNVFHTPKRMNYFLQNSSKAKRRLTNEKDLPAFRDQVVSAGVSDLCQSLFRKSGLESMSEAELSELFKQIRFRFSSNVNQIARVTGLPYATVASLLDRA